MEIDVTLLWRASDKSMCIIINTKFVLLITYWVGHGSAGLSLKLSWASLKALHLIPVACICLLILLKPYRVPIGARSSQSEGQRQECKPSTISTLSMSTLVTSAHFHCLKQVIGPYPQLVDRGN